MKIIPYLELMVRRDASDLYLTTGAFASIKVMGNLEGISKNKLKPGVIAAFAKELMSDKEWAVFHRTKEMNKGVFCARFGKIQGKCLFSARRSLDGYPLC